MREFWSTVVGGRATVEERPRYRAVLDLGSEQIKALVLELKGAEGLVIGVGRASHQQEWGMDGAVFDIQAMARSCDEALRQAEDMTAEVWNRQVVPDWVVVGLPNYLTTAQAFAVTHHRTNPARRISAKELTAVVERAERMALQQLAVKTKPLQSSPEEKVALLECAVTDMQVDGHSVTNPVDFRGQNLTVSVFNVVVSSSYLRAVEAIIEDLGLEILTKVSSWQALASALDEREGICIDVGGRSTDILLARNGKAWATASLPFGGSYFTRHLVEAIGLSRKDAESLKLAYARGVMKGSAELRVAEEIEGVMRVWLQGIEKTLDKLSGPRALPHQLSLCGGGSSLPGMLEGMRSYPWAQVLSFRRHPQVRLMQPGEVSQLLDRTGQIGGQWDVAPLALAGYTLDCDGKSDPLERVLRRVKRPAIFGSREGRA